MLLHGLGLGGHRIENAAVLGEDLPLGLLIFVHLEEQVENLPWGIDLMHRQPVLVPRDLGKVKVFAGLKDQRLETGAGPNPIGHRLVNGQPVLAVQLVEVTGENAHAWRVAKTVLHGRVVQPAENLQVVEVIGQLGEQGRRGFECAIRLRDQLGLIKT